MSVFDRLRGHEQVVFFNEPSVGLRAIVAIYSTALGPAAGGTRFRPYVSEAAALDDVLELSQAMAYKCATAGLDLGGGKAVIIGDPARDKSPELLRAYGRCLQSLGGRYYTACDVGTYNADLDGPRAAGWAEVEEWVLDVMAAGGRSVQPPMPLPGDPATRLRH